MVSLLLTFWRRIFGPPPRLVCDGRLWNDGVDELRRRAGGHRESGAFLLGTIENGARKVRRFVYYDDIDPTCFANGIVEFDGTRFGLVWQICRESQLAVVADVHVHPRGYGQSSTDRHNPIIPESGHLALILPDFASRARLPGDIGIYEYLGSRRWLNHSSEGPRFFRIQRWSL